jgi:hypothetical protein
LEDLLPPVIATDPEDSRPANPFIWGSLFLVFFLLIALAVYGYLSSSKKPSVSYEQIQSQMQERALGRAVLEFGSSPSQTIVKDDAVVKKLLPLKEKDVLAEKLYLESKRANGELISAADAKLLVDSKDPGDNAFAKIYLAKKLTAQEAQQVSSALPDDPFVNQQAKIVALQKAGVKRPYLQVVGQQRAAIYASALIFIMLALGAGSCLWIVYIAARSGGKLLPLGHPSEPMLKPWPERYAVRVLQLLLAFVSLGFLGVAFLHGLKNHFVEETIESLALPAMLPLMYFIPIYGKRISAKRQGWTSKNLGKNIIWGLSAAVANAPVLLVLSMIGKFVFSWLPDEAHPIALELTTHRSLVTFILATVSASVCAPIFEETLFRGTLLPALTSKFGSMVWGILISSFFFAAMHPTGPPAWFPLAGIGAISALLTYQTKSIVPSVVMHAAHNLAMVLLTLALT